MSLSENIRECRRRAGLSQEALAERLGVSRQAVSKWETGESEPSLAGLCGLAETFGVTVDFLLSGQKAGDKASEKAESSSFSAPEMKENLAAPNTAPPSWVEAVPGVVGRMLRKYGWLYGVSLAVSGALFLALGALARYLSRAMFSSFMADPMWSELNGANAFNPVSIMGGAVMIFGGILLVAGVVFAVLLKRYGRKK